jgi:hypothetical protein
MPAELPLVPSAALLALGGLVLLLPAQIRWSRPLGVASIIAAALLPIALDPFVDPARSIGQALWQWSAIGGPTVQAAYHLDPLAAAAIALSIAFAGCASAAAARLPRRHPALSGLILAIGLVAIALVVTSDLVAAVVVLSALAALTALALLAFAPAAATARAAAYLAIGLQSWVLCALLISRHGSAGFGLDDLKPGAVTPGALLAATVGGLLFAGLYPVVAWMIEPEGALDPGPLGSLILMPAGISASLLVVRLLGASGAGAGSVPLPEVGPDVRLGLIVVILVSVALAVGLSGRIPLRPIAVGAVAIVLVAALPALGWAHLVLFATLLTAVYGGVVSLAWPDHWETIRSDLALVVLWIGVATASPLGVAGGLVALFARAGAALASSLWLEPDIEYIALAGGSAAFLVGALAGGLGASHATDPSVAMLGLAASAVIVVAELAQLARRSPAADVPVSLIASSTVVVLLLAALAAICAVPLEAIARDLMLTTRTLDGAQVVAIAASAAVAVILARAGRPVLPYLEAIAERSERAMAALDPVPIGVGVFRALEAATARSSIAFGAFEARAGVWLATLLIAALLVWAVR